MLQTSKASPKLLHLVHLILIPWHPSFSTTKAGEMQRTWDSCLSTFFLVPQQDRRTQCATAPFPAFHFTQQRCFFIQIVVGFSICRAGHALEPQQSLCNLTCH